MTLSGVIWRCLCCHQFVCLISCLLDMGRRSSRSTAAPPTRSSRRNLAAGDRCGCTECSCCRTAGSSCSACNTSALLVRPAPWPSHGLRQSPLPDQLRELPSSRVFACAPPLGARRGPCPPSPEPEEHASRWENVIASPPCANPAERCGRNRSDPRCSSRQRRGPWWSNRKQRGDRFRSSPPLATAPGCR